MAPRLVLSRRLFQIDHLFRERPIDEGLLFTLGRRYDLIAHVPKREIMGRPSKLTPRQQREALERRANGEALVDIARTFNVSHATISRLLP
jgi:DNA-binding NarL/FixJ family response regulator